MRGTDIGSSPIKGGIFLRLMVQHILRIGGIDNFDVVTTRVTFAKYFAMLAVTMNNEVRKVSGADNLWRRGDIGGAGGES